MEGAACPSGPQVAFLGAAAQPEEGLVVTLAEEDDYCLGRERGRTSRVTEGDCCGLPRGLLRGENGLGDPGFPSDLPPRSQGDDSNEREASGDRSTSAGQSPRWTGQQSDCSSPSLGTLGPGRQSGHVDSGCPVPFLFQENRLFPKFPVMSVPCPGYF